ncbi:hypothetical protein ABZ817_16830 [Streptomyces antimycoticus]|uniref:hypothetical protein n=1 Tax=Streptomyces antimycoticus TaxID=68175 RepID=UPI0033C16FDE
MEWAKLAIDAVKVAIWPATVLVIVMLFRKHIRHALEQRDVRFEALGMNVEISRQVAAAEETLNSTLDECGGGVREGLDGASASRVEVREILSNVDEYAPRRVPDISSFQQVRRPLLPRGEQMRAALGVISVMPPTISRGVRVEHSKDDLIMHWNKLNRLVDSVSQKFKIDELDVRGYWAARMLRACGGGPWGVFGASWSRLRRAIDPMANHVGGGVWEVRPESPHLEPYIAGIMADTIGRLYSEMYQELTDMAEGK